jgi:NADH:ubiquinone oxidoreductase subunit D
MKAQTPSSEAQTLMDVREAQIPESVSLHHDPDDLWGDSRVIVNIGPTHPAMHGALRMVAKLNGETIENSYCEFGYTHRAKEKLGENRTYHQFVVYTDRLNYCSALINNVTYAMAVERLMGIQVPERTVWIRMICAEMARVIDHLICVGINWAPSRFFFMAFIRGKKPTR